MAVDIHSFFRGLVAPFRRRRMRRFVADFELGFDDSILDLGGTPFNWLQLTDPPQPVIVNLELPDDARALPGVRWVLADARRLPFRDTSFSVVFSNSVIEHLGGDRDQTAFANECARVGRRYFVQTPNRGFFLEPHLLTPFFHWLPKTLQRRLIRSFTVRSWISRPSRDWCDRFLATTRLLSASEFFEMFPEAELQRERFLGMVKSLIVVKK